MKFGGVYLFEELKDKNIEKKKEGKEKGKKQKMQ